MLAVDHVTGVEQLDSHTGRLAYLFDPGQRTVDALYRSFTLDEFHQNSPRFDWPSSVPPPSVTSRSGSSSSAGSTPSIEGSG